MLNNIKLSFIVPVYNEQESIEKVIKDIIILSSNINFKTEIIVVNDGSIDSTYTIVNNLIKNYDNISFISHSKNLGFGAAFKTGILNSNGKYLVLIPGDGECNIENVILGTVLLDQVDLVIPFVHNKECRNFNRRLISYIYTLIIWYTLIAYG